MKRKNAGERMPAKGDRAEKDPFKTIQTANRLLDEGNTNMAMVYFWSAGQLYEKAKEFKLAAQAYEKAGYCYELEDKWDKAAEDYLLASKMYRLAGLSAEAAKMRNMANQNMEKARD
ncbi:MAG: hypothetical protein ACFFB3_17940 [Candidatus Hodarchaeota archaeon]